MTDYAIRHGFLAESGPDAVPAWSAHATGYLHEDHYPPCLVVTGDLDAARRRLAPLDDAAIERAARVIYPWGDDWTTDTENTRERYRSLARVALAAAEETPDA